jgi:hypothetical protein
MGGIFLLVFARSSLFNTHAAIITDEGVRYRELEVVGDSVRTGMMGVIVSWSIDLAEGNDN